MSRVSCPERTEEEESPHSGGSGRVLRRLRLCVRGSEPEEEAGTKPTCAPPTPPCSASTRYRQQRLQQPPPLLVHQDADAQSPPWRVSESGTTVGGAVRASRADQYCIAPLVVVPPLQVGATLSMAQILALLIHINSGQNLANEITPSKSPELFG